MKSQNEGNNATKTPWTVIGAIDPSHMDTTYLPEVVVDMGKRNLVELLNSRLCNPRFEVKFDFPKVKRTLIEGEFSELALFYHDLTIPKPTRVLATTDAIKEVFDVIQVMEDDATITYTVYLDEGPFANSIEETVYNINRVLGPKVETKAKQLGLNDYHMMFNISLAY
ncbi:hypothetical protein MHB40_03125 [Lysinibacillus sp. FSL K6-0057]|uniref:hypothetical protein n=1 Tax=Lysinibacillus sp. FSL K6-0057 TaxID=2921411 RepID=UPI00315AA501